MANSYSWDYDNRLIVAAVGGGYTLTNTYDAMGLRQASVSGFDGAAAYTYDGQTMNLLRQDIAGSADGLEEMDRFTTKPDTFGALVSQCGHYLAHKHSQSVSARF